MNLAYNLANEPLGESFTGGILNGLSVTNGYDQYLRRSNLSILNSPSSILAAVGYGYDAASRLQTVNDGHGDSATYSYLANSPLVGQIAFANGNAKRMTTTKQYDYLSRLTHISSVPSASGVLPANFDYSYNLANQRTKIVLADGSYWAYQYDSLGQVTNGCKYFANGTLVPGQQFDYAFDNIGNRTQTLSGGDTNGANLRVANYTNNTLNQITSREVPPFVDIMGASILTNVVTVNGQTAYRNQEYFRQQLPANNAASALWTNIIVSGGPSVAGNVYVAQEPEHFSYDPDGNLTKDGRWAYTWDAENRLIGMTTNTTIGPPYQLAFRYDPKGRRIQKTVTNGIVVSTVNYIYDGWNLIAEMQPNNTPIRTYVWGSDLSGSMQGAGGVGGLLEVSAYGSATTNCFTVFDGNGNVAGLVNVADGTILASYEYGPFGEVIRQTGPMAKANPIRFSTKYQDDETDLLYYGYRYYKPSTGTWPNRDPINELGFKILTGRPRQPFYLNEEKTLYVFVGNEPIALFDLLGLDDGLGPIHTPQNNNSGKDIEKNCKCILTCADKEALKRGLQGAEAILQKEAGKTFNSWADFENALIAGGVQQVGETTGLLNGSLTDTATKRLTDGQQCIVKYFESKAFTGKPGNGDHPHWIQSYGAIDAYINQWIDAEDSRLQNAIAEISDAEKIEGCPSYGPKNPRRNR